MREQAAGLAGESVLVVGPRAGAGQLYFAAEVQMADYSEHAEQRESDQQLHPRFDGDVGRPQLEQWHDVWCLIAQPAVDQVEDQSNRQHSDQSNQFVARRGRADDELGPA